MENISLEFLQILLFTFIITGNIIGYKKKAILKSKEYRVSLWFHFKDDSQFRDLIRNEEEPRLKSKYKLLYWSEVMLLPLLIITFLLIIKKLS